MAGVKVAVIGAGSFVFGPSVMSQALLEHKLDDIHIALVDLDGPVVELMAGVGQRVCRELGLKSKVTWHTDRTEALAGADFVMNSAARQIHKRFAMDVEVAKRFSPDHLITEFSGIAGISYTLRQIALVQEICTDIRKLCPKAKLLNAANPLPRVAQAAQEEGVETIGFCSAAAETYARLWQLFTGEQVNYPWTKIREKWQLVMGGTNHFVWLVAMIDKATRRDLLPQLKAKLDAGDSVFAPRSEKLFRETGVLLFPNDNHTKDFLPPDGTVTDRTVPSHGTPEEKAARMDAMKKMADGTLPWDGLFAHPSWERPVDLIAGLAYNKPASFDALNLVNKGSALVPQLPASVFVEVPASADATGIHGRSVNLPARVLPYAMSAARLSDALVKAARKRSKAAVREAVELDPTILDKSAGKAAVDACIALHSDVLPVYS